MAKARKQINVEGQFSLDDFFAMVSAETKSAEETGEPAILTIADYMTNIATEDELIEAEPIEPHRIESNIIKRKGKAVVFNPEDEPDIPLGYMERVTANILALQELETLSASGEYATPDQQKILYAYSGWEGISELALGKEDMKEVMDELLAHFSQEQVNELLGLPQYPYHASDMVMGDINKILTHIGFKDGSVLVAGIGSGNIFRGLTRSLRSKSLVNIDATDGVNGQISSYLFPKTEVMDMSNPLYESFYDVAIGLVPAFPETEGRLTFKRNSITLPSFACQIGRTLNAIRVGGFYLMLIDARRTDDMKEHLTPFSLSTAPLDFIGGLRMDSAVMNNDTVYDILVFQKIADKRKARTRNVFEIERPGIQMFGDTRFIATDFSSYFHNNREFIIGGSIFTRGSNGLIIGSLSEDKHKDSVAHALDRWSCKKLYTPITFDAETEHSKTLPADPNVKNFGMAVIDGEVYQRIDSRMIRQKLAGARLERAKGMISIRDHARKVYELQLAECSDETLSKAQSALTRVYDKFVAEFGHITNGTNRRIMREDADYTLLASLETVDEEDEVHKSDIFSMRTIMMRKEIIKCDTIAEAVFVCLDQKGYVDVEHISRLCDTSEDKVIDECVGRTFFRNPNPSSNEDVWITKDKYLSGNVKEKLKRAEAQALTDVTFEVNVEALKSALPPIIPAEDIKISLGAPFIPTDMIQQFLFEVIGDNRIGDGPEDYVLSRDKKNRWKLKCHGIYSDDEPRIFNEFGTPDYDAFTLVKNMLNLSEIVAYKDETDPATGLTKRVKDQEQTVVILEKAEAIETAFRRWVLDGDVQETRLVHSYNETMNTNVVPKYDGSHLTFPGMTASVKLGAHQKNAVYRIICNNGDLIAHVVGGGKTFTMLAAGMELRRIGRVSKPMYVVPNNLLSQWGGEAMRLYPTAKVLLAEPDDMRKKRRTRFLSRMATGDYDIIIVGSSSFINLPPPFSSVTESMNWLIDRVDEVKGGEKDYSKPYSAKDEKTRLAFFNRCRTEEFDLETIGADFMFVDESHEYKNLSASSSHSNLRGLSNSSNVAKCTDMYYKTKYFNRLHNGRGGFVFATGTAITNSIVEMYSLLRYYYEDELLNRGITSLDEWLSFFGNVERDWELPPEGLAEDGSGFRQVERVASFANIPELMGMVLQFMDSVTRDEINMETPVPIRKTVTCLQSLEQKAYMKELVARANAIRKRNVNPSEDNMLCVTVDGRKSALDLRIVDDKARNHKNSKITLCAQQVVKFYEQFSPIKGTQLVFCDIGVPNGKGFNVYDAIKEKLKSLGIPDDEIAFAHDFKTPAQRVTMRLKMQTGKLRVLIGSTATLGQGVNVQNRLIALHHLDVPWTPKDFEQREGRILRPGNMNEQAYILSYVTEGSFDAYMYQIIELKAKLISQIMRGDFTQRVIEDIDTKILSYAEIKAIATGDTRFLERAKIEGTLSRLETLKRDYVARTAALRDSVNHTLPRSISQLETMIERIGKDVETIGENSGNIITVGKEEFDLTDPEQKDAAIDAFADARKTFKSGDCVGMYKGLSIVFQEGTSSYSLYTNSNAVSVVLQGLAAHSLENNAVGTGAGIILSCEKIIREIPDSLALRKEKLKAQRNALVAAEELLKEGFEHDEEITRLRAEFERLNVEISNAA